MEPVWRSWAKQERASSAAKPYRFTRPFGRPRPEKKGAGRCPRVGLGTLQTFFRGFRSLLRPDRHVPGSQKSETASSYGRP